MDGGKAIATQDHDGHPLLRRRAEAKEHVLVIP
jgi:hypothetical protein